jgi:hypothetical protein
MSIRIFEAAPDNAHNGAMATDRHQAPSYPLRMPDELKTRVAAAAQASGRSLHAELLFRLGESFRQVSGEAELAKAQMQTAESRMREAIAQGEALFLGSCVSWLLGLARENKIVHEGDAAVLAKLAEETAQKVLDYQRELNPAIRLEEYKREVERSRALSAHWMPNSLAWPGDHPEDIQAYLKDRENSKSNVNKNKPS